jgi:hypothetical protein
MKRPAGRPPSSSSAAVACAGGRHRRLGGRSDSANCGAETEDLKETNWQIELKFVNYEIKIWK